MIVNVHLADGRTVFQFASRGDLRAALNREPACDERALVAWVKWSPKDRWQPLRTVFVRKTSVAFVVSAEDAAVGEDDLPAKATRDRRLERHLAQQADPDANTATAAATAAGG